MINHKGSVSKSKMAISVRNLNKKYQLYETPKHRLKEALHPFRKKYHREFWALKDVSFDVRQGETVGIIGQNGSGKSTLLQIIYGTMTSTLGELEVNGKVSALLELGAGFNPEFSGRDNVYLNGSIMGLSRKAMDKRIEDIASFADIGEFMDQPVKTYSSGMYVRLAFACAINVDPDILIIDEALSVGDAKFQSKCFQKFKSFQENGKTIMLVSHSTDAIINHCNYAFLLDNGHIVKRGKPKDVVNCYYELIHMENIQNSRSDSCSKDCTLSQEDSINPSINVEKTELDIFFEEIQSEDRCIIRKSYNKYEHRFGNKKAEIVDYLIMSNGNYDSVTVSSGDTIDIYLKAKYYHNIKLPACGFSIKTIDGIVVFASNTRYMKYFISPIKENNIIVFRFSVKLNLHPGEFFLDLGIGETINDEPVPLDFRYNLIHFSVQQKNVFDGLVEFEATIQQVLRKPI